MEAEPSEAVCELDFWGRPVREWRCDHGKSYCKECSFGLCQHGERGDRCRECNTHFCVHGRRKGRCKDCGTGMCEHGRIKERCRECKPRPKKEQPSKGD